MASLRSTAILIVHPDRKTQRTVQRILGVTGYPIEIADDLDQGTRLLHQLAPILVIVDHTAIADTGRATEFFAAARARGAEACMTLLGSATAAEHIPKILGSGAVTNLLVHPMPVLGEELVITAQKLIQGDLFGAEKYLLWGTTLESTTLTRASQRAEITGELAEQVKARGQSARVASMARLVADELLSNAVHNAPVDDAGEHYRRDIPRDIEIELEGRHQVRLRWGCDARYVAIEVSDRWGSLGRETILRALAKNEVRESGGGAGMGIALAYRSCDHLVFNLAPGRATEIIALVELRYPPERAHERLVVQRVRGAEDMTETRGRLQVTTETEQLVLAGLIDETATVGELLAKATNGKLVLDLAGVTFINSLGVRDWIRMQAAAQKSQLAVELRRVSEPVVHQLNMIIATRGDARVTSFFAPYACDACGREESILVDAVAHGEKLARLEAPPVKCPECGAQMAFNDFPERYFSFLAPS